MAARKKRAAKKKRAAVEEAPVIEVGEPTPADLDEIGEHDTEPPPPPDLDGEVTAADVYPTPANLPLETEEEVREHILAVCEALLPSGVGDPPFEWMTQGRSLVAKRARKFFSTCGELAMCALYCVGYRGPVLNWELKSFQDGEQRAYLYGQNMALIYGAEKWRRSRQEGLWVKARPGHNGPSPGDVLFVSNGPPRTEHVAVFIGVKAQGPGTDETWEVWQAGGGGVLDQHGGKGEAVRRLYGRGRLIMKLNDRQLHGWLDVGKLVGKLTRPPVLPPF